MNKVQIVMRSHVDRSEMQAGSFFVDVVYRNQAAVQIDLNEMDSTYREAFMKTIDYLSMNFESGANVFIIQRDDKTFDLSQSYWRDQVSTQAPRTSLPVGTPIKVRFDIPGFKKNNFRVIDLWTASGFDSDQLDQLAEIGISISGNGDLFTITNQSDCMVSFLKPAGAPENYVIDDFESDNIINP